MEAGLVHSRRVTEQAAAVHSSALTLCEFGIKFKVGKTFPKHPKITSIHTLIIQTPAFLIDIPICNIHCSAMPHHPGITDIQQEKDDNEKVFAGFLLLKLVYQQWKQQVGRN